MTEMMVRLCRDCKVVKETYTTGKQVCRECNNAYLREYKKKNLEKVLAIRRKSRMKIFKASRTQRIKDYANKRAAKWIKQGKILRTGCEVCGEFAEAHHDSYAKENYTNVRFLCRIHHAEWHRFNEPTF